jgi:hypothetical protein
MKKLIITLTTIFSLSTLATTTPPHLDLEMSSAEYREHLRNVSTLRDDPAITQAIGLGNRLSQWIALVNETRSSENAIRLSSSQNRGSGIPIDKPSSYSPALIKERVTSILNDLPQEIKIPLLSTEDFSSTLPVDDETFIKHARLIDRQYQSAARYKSVNQWRSYYIEAANQDVRGYYYLTTQKISAQDIRDISLIDPAKLESIKNALIQICQNATSNLKTCTRNLAKAYKNNKLADFYTRYIDYARENWDSFFKIPRSAYRKDIVWNESTAVVPFNTPKLAKFIPYLQDNIEDEFRFGTWGLKLNFGSFYDGPRLIFKPNVVPHVNALGGNEIVMDSNQPIEEFDSQWTIRHEFGHVLGLPDCYHEFYDVTQEAYVNYQFDVTDLMCSRAGNMNERIYLELKKAYQQ